MKLQIEEIPDLLETEIIIRCKEVDSKINKISNYIRTSYITIQGKIDNTKYVLNLDDIYYFETVENHTYAYTEKEVYGVNYKLQEIISLVEKTSFIQISRTMVLNINKIETVKHLVNGRINATLANNEKMIISRVYANAFKKKINE